MEKYLSYITTLSIVIGAVFSFVKYIDLRNREEKRRNYENFIQITDKLGAITNPNHEEKLSATEWIITLYQLQNLKNYSEIIIPILDFLKKRPPEALNYIKDDICEAVDYVQKQLVGSNKKTGQILRSAQNDSNTTVV